MNADERLDQLEPLLSEALTVLDRHTFQLKQLQSAVGQLVTAVTQHGDSIEFLLRELAAIKIDVAELKADMAEVKGDMAEMKDSIADMKDSIADMKGDVAELKGGMKETNAGMSGMNGKLDLLVQLLQQPGK